ncbi:hypothetical protein [Nocardia sp. NBC_01327]|uniref:hypothetical protein n=1 Tax=Nocardia sp. NBC_01327 TaxID=2903593 RepID=UPI002E13091C|nr:hypothetical protein OG326_19000 [Nocardia sp. NBC_01327]
MNVVADRVNRLCGLLGSPDDQDGLNDMIAAAAAANAILARTVTRAEIAAVRSGEGDAPPDLLRAIAIHFDIDPRYVLEPDLEEMRVLDQKLSILETARTLGIKLGAVHFRGGAMDVEALDLLVTTIRDARSAAHPHPVDAPHGGR